MSIIIGIVLVLVSIKISDSIGNTRSMSSDPMRSTRRVKNMYRKLK